MCAPTLPAPDRPCGGVQAPHLDRWNTSRPVPGHTSRARVEPPRSGPELLSGTPPSLAPASWSQNPDTWLARVQKCEHAGNIRFAPVANNWASFQEYYRRMLVIGGVEAETNSHTPEVIHNTSGRISERYPTPTALLARHCSGLAVPYVSFGGSSNTAGVTAFTRLNDPEHFQVIARPQRNPSNEERPFLVEADWDGLQEYRDAIVTRVVSAPDSLPRASRNCTLYEAALLPSLTEGPWDSGRHAAVAGSAAASGESANDQCSELKHQAQITALVFKSRVEVSADLWLGGFATHVRPDT